jgi:hypothetical protein
MERAVIFEHDEFARCITEAQAHNARLRGLSPA